MKTLLLFLGIFCLLFSFMTACGNDEPQTQKSTDKTTEAAKEEPKGAIDPGIEEAKETIETEKKEAVEVGIQKTEDVIESAEEKTEDAHGEAQKKVEGFLDPYK